MLVKRTRPKSPLAFKGYTDAYTGLRSVEAPRKWPFGRVPPKTYKATPRIKAALDRIKAKDQVR